MSGETENGRILDGDLPLRIGDEPPLAAHLVSPRAFYTHHGIYVGNGHVIHYAGLACGLRRGPVENVSLDRFAHGHEILIRHDSRLFDGYAIVERARSRLGERSYRLLTNNCEHFCSWALSNERRSPQVERLREIPRALAHALRTLCGRITRHHRAIQVELRGWSNRHSA